MLPAKEIRKLRRDQLVVKTAIHPDTGEFIPFILRFSTFIPMQVPIYLSLVLPAPTPFNTIVSNWINQSYNAVVNYGNRNASSSYTTTDILKGYAAATSSSVFVALGIRKLVENQTRSMVGAKLLLYNSFSVMIASAIGGFVNAWFMRQAEKKRGIDVMDPETDEIIGKSQVAGSKAVFETGLSRSIISCGILFPTTALLIIERASLMPVSMIGLKAL